MILYFISVYNKHFTYWMKNIYIYIVPSTKALSTVLLCATQYFNDLNKFSSIVLKVAEDDMTFKLAIFLKSFPFNENAGFCSLTQVSKLVFRSLLANNFLYNFQQKCNLLDGQLWEWLTSWVAPPQPKCNWGVRFAIPRRPAGKVSDNACIMLSTLFRYSHLGPGKWVAFH